MLVINGLDVRCAVDFSVNLDNGAWMVVDVNIEEECVTLLTFSLAVILPRELGLQ